jgi:hypothetical protein
MSGGLGCITCGDLRFLRGPSCGPSCGPSLHLLIVWRRSFPDYVMPGWHGELAGDQDGAAAVAILDNRS